MAVKTFVDVYAYQRAKPIETKQVAYTIPYRFDKQVIISDEIDYDNFNQSNYRHVCRIPTEVIPSAGSGFRPVNYIQKIIDKYPQYCLDDYKNFVPNDVVCFTDRMDNRIQRWCMLTKWDAEVVENKYNFKSSKAPYTRKNDI